MTLQDVIDVTAAIVVVAITAALVVAITAALVVGLGFVFGVWWGGRK